MLRHNSTNAIRFAVNLGNNRSFVWGIDNLEYDGILKSQHVK